MGDLQRWGGSVSILKLCKDLPLHEISAGQVLLSEGTRTGRLYVLVSGEVEILKGNFRLDIVNESGAVFGEVSLLRELPHMATVRAITPLQIYKIENAAAFLDSHPQVVLELARLLAHRLSRAMDFLVDLKHQSRGLTGVLIGMAIEEQDLPLKTTETTHERFA